MREKEFRDSVHGYITVPVDYCTKIIDTALFQRLRRIEQTSMRPLFPSAHHDRFIHSLGVFYLGRLAFATLQKNAPPELQAFDWEKYRTTFELACLLHDCAHAPFSHTFEHYYDYGENALQPKLEAQVQPAFWNDFSTGGDDDKPLSPAQHETASAILVLTELRSAIIELNGDPELIARMILGCVYTVPSSEEERVVNCLIRLLNGSAIDVDKLDYIIRDTWTSGVQSVNIDVRRLLSSLCLVSLSGEGLPKTYELGFRKSALSVVHNVVLGRNFLYEWIYSHHTVQYDCHILKKAIEDLPSVMENIQSDNFFKEVFSLKALCEPVTLGTHRFYLPSDGDFVFLLKAYAREIPAAQEWISRQYRLGALWKTHAEYRLIFKKYLVDYKDNYTKAMRSLQKKAKEWLGEKFPGDNCFESIEVKPKLVSIKQSGVLIEVSPSHVISYEQLFPNSHEKSIDSFCYVYCPQDADAAKRDGYIECLKKCIESLAS